MRSGIRPRPHPPLQPSNSRTFQTFASLTLRRSPILPSSGRCPFDNLTWTPSRCLCCSICLNLAFDPDFSLPGCSSTFLRRARSSSDPTRDPHYTDLSSAVCHVPWIDSRIGPTSLNIGRSTPSPPSPLSPGLPVVSVQDSIYQTLTSFDLLALTLIVSRINPPSSVPCHCPSFVEGSSGPRNFVFLRPPLQWGTPRASQLS